METSLLCPQCGLLVEGQDRECPNCGVNLALAVGLAERALTAGFPFHPSLPVAPEILVPRLGEILLEKGVLSDVQLQSALKRHTELIKSGQPCLFGKLLLELGLVNQEILDQVVTEQIFQLQQALQASNLQLEQRVSRPSICKMLYQTFGLSELKSISSRISPRNTPHPYEDTRTSWQMVRRSLEEEQSGCRRTQRSEMRLEQLIGI
jgi:hypothetical protein